MIDTSYCICVNIYSIWQVQNLDWISSAKLELDQ